MPITVTAPQGVLTEQGAQDVLPLLSAALLEVTGGTGNSFLTSIVGGTVQQLPAADIYAGGANRPVVTVELKLPHIALESLETRRQFMELAGEVVDRCTIGAHDPENTWVNILHAADGAWGIGGRQYTAEAIAAAITQAGR